MIERIDMELGDNPEADQFTEDLKALLAKYDYDLVTIVVGTPDGNLLGIENKKHVKTMHVTHQDELN